MTYTEEQKKAHVYALQNALFELHKNDKSIPRVNPDGIYGPETTISVQEFQRQTQLPATGRVDHATWDAIFTRYFDETRERRSPIAIQPFVRGPIDITRGQVSTAVGMVQIMLWELSRVFSNIHAVPITLVYDEATIQQLYTVQRMSSLQPHDVLDVPTWNAVVILYNLTAQNP